MTKRAPIAALNYGEQPCKTMNGLNRMISLIAVTAFFTVTLFGFTLWNKDKIIGNEQGENFYCGTSAIGNDVIFRVDISLINDSKASQGEVLFKANCKACHRLDQKLVGPALRHVYNHRDSVWISKMIVNANQMVREKDKLAVALYNEYNQVSHTEFTGLKKTEVAALMRYLKVVGGN
jgi:cytochrome c2